MEMLFYKLNKRFFFAICVLLLCIVTTQTIKAEFSYKIEGTVKYNGKGIGGVAVSLQNSSGKTKVVTTNSTGAYSLSLDPNEEYTIIITKDGFTKAQIIYSTMGFSVEDAKKFKGSSQPEIELFNLPADEQAIAKINEILDKPLLSYYYNSDKNTMVSDETFDESLEEELDKVRKIVGTAGSKEAQLVTQDADYKNTIAKADKAFAAKDYAAAKASYKAAAIIKSTEEYPKTKINEIDIVLADLAAKEKAATEKERLVKEKAAADAAEKERLAKEKATTEAAEKDRIAKEKAATEEAEKERMAKEKAIADAAAKERITRQKAMADSIENDRIIKEKAVADAAEKERINKEKAATDAAEKERLAKEAEANILTKKYETAIAKGDSALTAKNYDAAKIAYNNALSLKPKETYPQNKLTEIETILTNLAKAEFTNELAKKYPQGVTEIKEKEGNSNITKRILVQGNKGYIYIKKETSFGTVYYFKDGVTISEQEFEKDTEVKK
jgi:hypothetical protein